MTVPELITRILAQLENQFYCHLPRRDFKRDETYLINAIGTYGHECAQRGWEFDTKFIYAELCRLLTSFKRAGTEITWMPNYLQNAIRRHIGEHAEELSAAAKNIRSLVKRAQTKLPAAPVVILEPTAAEVLGRVYKDVARLRRRNAAERKASRADKKRQGVLL